MRMSTWPFSDGEATGAQDGGGAIVVALVAALLMSAVGLGLITMSSTERAIAGNFLAAHGGRLAAEAALERALADVRRHDPSDLLSGAATSAFRDSTLNPVTPWGSTLDLPALTAALQARTDASFGWSANNPHWRLWIYGPFERLVPAGNSRLYVVVWLGDDLGETDGSPLTDENDTLVVLARALGPAGLSVSVRAAVMVEEGVRVLSWKEANW